MITRRRYIDWIALLCMLTTLAYGAGENVDVQEVEPPPEEVDPKAIEQLDEFEEAVKESIQAQMAKAARIEAQHDVDLGTVWDFMPQVPEELQHVVPPNPNSDGGEGFLLKLHSSDGARPIAYWYPISAALGAGGPWSFSKTNDTQGVVSPGLMLVRNEVRDTDELTAWNGGLITVGTSDTHFYVEFTIDGATITQEWTSGTSFPDGADGATTNTPTYTVPVLEFTLTTNDTISTWTQHQWGNIPLSRL